MQKTAFLNSPTFNQTRWASPSTEIGPYTTVCSDYVLECKKSKVEAKFEEVSNLFQISEEIQTKLKKLINKNGTLESYISFINEKFDSEMSVVNYIKLVFKNI